MIFPIFPTWKSPPGRFQVPLSQLERPCPQKLPCQRTPRFCLPLLPVVWTLTRLQLRPAKPERYSLEGLRGGPSLSYQPHLQPTSAYRLGRDLWLTCRQAWHQHTVQESCDLGPSGRPRRCSRQVETVASSRVRGRVVAETLSKTTPRFTWRQRVAGF